LAKNNDAVLVEKIHADPDVRTAVSHLVGVLLDEDTTPAKLYTAERGLILAVEAVVKGYR
jgi:hypothetical protein